jgi:antitoxin component YwqK of YwqJK toxin-antitoxin module
MKIKPIVLFCLLLAAPAAHGQQVVAQDSLEERADTYYYQGRPFTGYADSFDERMKMYTRQQVVDGKNEGSFKGYYDRERTKIGWEVPCHDNIVEGLYVAYHDNGRISFTVYIHRNKMRGKRYCYDEQGRLWHIHTYRRDRQNGPMLTYFTESGRLFSDRWFRGDKATGRCHIYYDAASGGGLQATGQMRNGEMTGLWKHYDTDGRLDKRVRPKKQED